MNTTWQKIKGDLRANTAQLLLVTLAIAIGTIALAAAFTARTVLTREVARNYESTSPADVTFWLDSIPKSLVGKVAQLPIVKAAEPRRLIRSRVEVAPGEWRPLLLFVVEDFTRQRVSTFRPETGKSLPAVGEVLAERSGLPVLRAKAGDSLTVRLPGGRVTRLRISGIVHDAGQAPGWQDNAGYAYVSPATVAALGGGQFFDELKITLRDGRRDITARAAQISSFLESSGWPVNRVEVSVGEHPHADHMRTMLLLLTFFFVLAMVLSGTLIANVLSALLARQTRQIGIMKAIGSPVPTVAGLYARLVLLVAVTGVGIGLPIGTFLGQLFCGMAAWQLNIELFDTTVPLPVIGLEIGIGILVPLLFAALPLISKLRTTTREALQFTGATVESSRRGRWLARLLPSSKMQLAVLNTFRRRGRLALTVGAIAMGGAVLLTALNVYRGIERAIDQNLLRRGDNIDVRLLKPAPAAALQHLSETVAGVTRVEAWGHALVSVQLSDRQAEQLVGSSRYALLAPPDQSRIWQVKVVNGTLPTAQEMDVLVINKGMQARIPALQTGTQVSLLLGKKRLMVRVRAVIEEIAEPALYTNRRTMEKLLGQVGIAGALRVETRPGQQEAVATALEEALIARGSFPLVMLTPAILKQSMLDHILILITCLVSAAIAVIGVGALGMGTSLSLNVVERWREIGIIRAMGAPAQVVLGLLLMEGLVTILLSIGLSILLSLPLIAGMGWMVGRHGLHVAVPFVFSPAVVSLWVGVALLITVVACVFSARPSLRMRVREVLAYE